MTAITIPISKPEPAGNPAAEFANACGQQGSLCVEVSDQETGKRTIHRLKSPFVIIGRSPDSTIRLDRDTVSHRHAYLQVVDGQVYCFDLDSHTGTYWPHGIQPCGWVYSDTPLTIGPFAIRAWIETGNKLANKPERNLLDNEPMSDLYLVFQNAEGRVDRQHFRPLRRFISLVGRSRNCHVRLSDSTISRVQCAFVRTGEQTWLVDLLGKCELDVNDVPVKVSLVTAGDDVRIGPFMARLQTDKPGSNLPVLHKSAKGINSSAPNGATSMSGNWPQMPGMPVLNLSGNPQWENAPVAVGLDRGTMIAPSGTGNSSDSLLLTVMDRFEGMQRMIMEQNQQQMVMMMQMFGALHQSQQEMFRQELDKIREITEEMQRLQRESMQAQMYQNAGAWSPPYGYPPVAGAIPELPAGMPVEEADSQRSASDVQQHAEVTERLMMLDQERKSRWNKLLGIFTGSKSE